MTGRISPVMWLEQDGAVGKPNAAISSDTRNSRPPCGFICKAKQEDRYGFWTRCIVVAAGRSVADHHFVGTVLAPLGSRNARLEFRTASINDVMATPACLWVAIIYFLLSDMRVLSAISLPGDCARRTINGWNQNCPSRTALSRRNLCRRIAKVGRRFLTR